MKKISLLILFGLLFFNAQSQMIKAIPFEKENSVFKLTYDLPAIASNYDVVLTSNYPTGRGFVKVTANALGDVGENILSGNNKTIYWQPEKGEDFNEAILEFKIVMIPLASANNSNDNGAESTVIEIPENIVAKRREAAKRKAEAEAKQKTELEELPEVPKIKTKPTSDFGTQDDEGEPNVTKPEKEMPNAISGAGANINGRTVRSKPDSPKNPGVQGVVLVKICIDVKGNVVKSKFSQEGSTISNNTAIAAAVANAKRWKFNEHSMAPEKQCGTITYYFKIK